MIPLYFFSFSELYNSTGSLATPIQQPLINTLTLPISLLMSSSTLIIYGFTYKYNEVLIVGIVICAI